MNCPILKKNEGTFDRVLRVLLGLMAIGAGYVVFTGTAQLVSYVIGAVLVITGALGFCGLYTLFQVSTKK